jgi:tyrosine-protein phosphatase YwqE
VLIEVPFRGPADLFFALCERAEAQGLRIVVAHPERTEAILAEPGLAEMAARGWLLQVNEGSLTGWSGPEREALGWQLLADGTAALVASDGHRLVARDAQPVRPPHLDEAYARAERRFGPAIARLFDGSALGLDVVAEELAAS